MAIGLVQMDRLNMNILPHGSIIVPVGGSKMVPVGILKASGRK